MRVFSLFLAISTLVGACDTPTIDYAGVPSMRTKVGKSVFDVRVRGDMAQAIRVNMEWAPYPRKIAPKFVTAIENVSGCKVVHLTGDQALMNAQLKC